MLTTAVGERAVSLRQNVKNGNVPQLKINSKNEIPVPGTGWGLIAGAAALMERTGGTLGKQAGYKPVVFWQKKRLFLHDLLELVVMEVVVCSCLALSRPLLEYCFQFWSPQCGRDIGKLVEMEQGAPRLDWAGILVMRERVMELGFFRRGTFVWTWKQQPCTCEKVFEKADSGTSSWYVSGK